MVQRNPQASYCRARYYDPSLGRFISEDPIHNGELLSLAETVFDALITVDTNLRYQQNMAGRRIGIVVLH
jgi:RHS repeat-associated protein